MSSISRAQIPLSDIEICIVKGLIAHRFPLGLNQQQIIAYFSFPQRTIHHNVISAISRDDAGTSDADYPPANIAACRQFKNLWAGDWEAHLRATQMSSACDSRLTCLSFAYRYHPVGQGLFCSGSFSRPNCEPFRWVYDCGIERGSRDKSRATHVCAEIDALACEQTGNHLDLVTLSHFDEDHLSGILDLLARFSVGTLLLPYLTPWERLIVALSKGAQAESDLLNFLIAPTSFLLERTEGRIGRIVLVPPSREGPALPPLLPPDQPLEGGETIVGRTEILIKDQEPEGEAEEDAMGADKGLLNPKVRLLHRGGWIAVAHAWEFVPYNDARLEFLATKAFKDNAQPLAKQLVHSASKSERKTALEALTKLYDRTFKTHRSKKISAFRRNEISLFLYAGPLGHAELTEASVTVPRHSMSELPSKVPDDWIGTHRFGQMLTGDGYLHTSQRLQDFESFFSVGNRLERAAILQIMHHGSSKNWRSGLAQKMAPIASIFCSDPMGKYGHPSAIVLSDFESFHPVQVDGVHGWKVEGVYYF